MKWTVNDVMSSEVVSVSRTTPFKQVAQILRAKNISSVPVVEAGGRVLGIVTEADLIAKESWHPQRLKRLQRWLLADELDKAAGRTAGQVMSAAQLVRPDLELEEAAHLMLTRQLHALPVVTDDHLVGIISQADLLKPFVREDDEIRGEIVTDVLGRGLWIRPDEAQVSVVNGAVTVSGCVETRSVAEIAGRTLEAVPGVVSVDNQLSWTVR
jgi:CBS-domain-containing membrane protein